MNITFNPNGNTRMTLRNPTANSKLMGFGRPAIIPARDVPFTGVRVGQQDGGGTTDYTTIATDQSGPIPGPDYNTFESSDSTLYLGFTEPFNAVKLGCGPFLASSGNNLAWKYFTTSPGAFGDTFVSNINETVVGLKNMRAYGPGVVYWDMPTNWIQTQPQVGMPLLYWISVVDQVDAANPIGVSIAFLRKTTPP